MKRETIIWTLLFVIGGLALLGRACTETGMGKVYVREVAVNADDPDPDLRWNRYDTVGPKEYVAAEAADPGQTVIQLSLSRTFGTWLAAFFTLAIFSFLYRDNPFYKLAESVVIGVSAAYWMVVGFWSTVVPNQIGRLWPQTVHDWAMPGLKVEGYRDLYFIAPLVLGGMLIWRLSPKGGWIARWPLSFIVGTFCGLRLVSFLQADFLSQIRNSIVPLAVMDPTGGFDGWASLANIIMIVGVLTSLVYFFFSFEHKGVVGGTAKVGMQFLMITFGASFGMTVMGRIALLAARLEFLFDDWLWLIDPTLKRVGM
jgi:hypothetical protein